jgi:hypothetical protein
MGKSTACETCALGLGDNYVRFAAFAVHEENVSQPRPLARSTASGERLTKLAAVGQSPLDKDSYPPLALLRANELNSLETHLSVGAID